MCDRYVTVEPLYKVAFCVMVNKIWQKHKRRIANWWSELITFEQKRKENKGKSDLTGRYYSKEDLQSFQFAHALPKGTYPLYRNNVNNIVFVDNIQQHHWVDSMVAGRKFEIELKVKEGTLISWLKYQRFLFIQEKKSWKDLENLKSQVKQN